MNLSCLIIAHRGESHDAPENTLSSINLAWQRSADAVEIDIQLTKDNNIVVFHDKNTKRICGKDKAVKKQTLAELRQLDAGSWKSNTFRNEKIPTLEEVLAAKPENNKLIIEIKCGIEILNELLRVINESRINSSQIELICFNLGVACETKKLFPNHAVLLLSELDYTWIHKIFRPSIEKLIEQCHDNNLDGLDLWAGNMLTAESIKKIKFSGLKLYVWTVNEFSTAKRLRELGIDGITTDRAQWLKEKLSKI